MNKHLCCYSSFGIEEDKRIYFFILSNKINNEKLANVHELSRYGRKENIVQFKKLYKKQKHFNLSQKFEVFSEIIHVFKKNNK